MRTWKYISQRWLAALSAVAWLVMLIGCGGNAPVADATPEINGLNKPAEINLAQVFGELEALTAPVGVDPAAFAELKSGLRMLLMQRASSKNASTPPDTLQSKVDDFKAVRYGDSVTFSFTYRNAGDYNQDRTVNTADLVALAMSFGATNADAEWPKRQIADGNRNGVVDLGDLTALAQNYGKMLDFYYLQYSPAGAADWSTIANVNWSDSIVPDNGGLRQFKYLVAQPAIGDYRIVPRDFSGTGIPSNVYAFPGAGLALSAWPMYGGNAQHTWRSMFSGPDSTQLSWTFQTYVPAESFTELAIATLGNVYVGRGNEVLALDSSGNRIWRYTLDAEINSRPAVGPDGTVYACSDQLYAISPDGVLQWKYPSAGSAYSPVAGADGAVYLRTVDSLLALSPAGTLNWQYAIPLPAPYSDPYPPANWSQYMADLAPVVVGPDGTIYTKSFEGELYAFSPAGALQWTFQYGNYSSPPAVGPDGRVYTGGDKLYALNPDGSLIWAADLNADVRSVVPAADGLLYIGTRYNLQVLDADGVMQWYHATSTGVTPPIIRFDGTVLVAAENEVLGLSTPAASNVADVLWSRDITGVSSLAYSADGTLYAQTALAIIALNPTGGGKDWTFTAPDRVRSSPAIGPDGTVYVGNGGGYLTAVDRNGELVWRFRTAEEITSSPALGADGTVYIGSTDGKFYALNSDGTLKWHYATGGAISSSPCIADDGTIYFGSKDGALYALKPDGTLLWSFARHPNPYHYEYIFSSPTLGAEGTIYVGSYDRYLFAVNADGTEKWRYRASAAISASPAVGADGMVYFADDEGQCYALRPDGTFKWGHDMSNSRCSPALGADGTVYFPSSSGLLAMDPDGAMKWQYGGIRVGYEETSVTIDAAGVLYVGSTDNRIVAVNADGSLKFEFAVGSAAHSSPVIGPNGALYAGCDDGMLYAFKN